MSEKKQVLKNLSVNVLSLVFKLLLGLWLTPYLVRYLGTAAYGFVPIATVLSEYITTITASINSAISRFLILNIQEEKWDDANGTFNTALVANASLVLLQIPIFVIVLFELPVIFDIPEELRNDVFYLVLFSAVAFFIDMASSVFSTSMFAKNRLDLMRYLDIMVIFVRTGFIVLLFTVDTPKLYYAGLGTLVASVLNFAISVLYWRKLTPLLRISPKLFETGKLKSILTMSVWLWVNWIGVLLFGRAELVIANRFVGVTEAGQYAAVQQWSNVIVSIMYVLSILATPLVLSAYANKNFKHLKHVTLTSVKLFGLFMSIVSGIVIVQSRNLLTIWIGPEIASIYPLLIIMLLHLPINLSVLPLFAVCTAYNRVKVPGLITLFAGIFNVGLAIVLASYTSLGIFGIAVSIMIVLTFNEAFFKPIYVARIMKERLLDFYLPILKTMLSTGLVLLVALPITLVTIDSWLDLILSSALVGIVVVPLIWILVMSKDDRTFLVKLFPNSVQKKLSWLVKQY